MKPLVLLLVALSSLWQETNSRAAARRGENAFAAKEYAQAAAQYGHAQTIRPSARNAFNLGTAQIAAGHREEGSATLEAALRDPSLRADALYNRGNSALAAGALDHAVRDYTGALRANPAHAAAKRNLEIALIRREQQRRSAAAGGQKDERGQSQQQPTPAAGQPQRPGRLDLEALLRSVQQQEQDELRRMKGRAPSDARVGW